MRQSMLVFCLHQYLFPILIYHDILVGLRVKHLVMQEQIVHNTRSSMVRSVETLCALMLTVCPAMRTTWSHFGNGSVSGLVLGVVAI